MPFCVEKFPVFSIISRTFRAILKGRQRGLEDGIIATLANLKLTPRNPWQNEVPLNPKIPLQADLIIHAKWVIPVVPEGAVYTDHAVAVVDRRIVAILPSAEARQSIQATRNIELRNHALIPGFVNAHGHSPMALFRGIADDMPLKQWLEHHIWPLEGKFVDPQFVRDGSMLAIAEMIAGGTTCFADMYFYPDETAKAAIGAQLRVQLACPVLDFPTVWARDGDEYIEKATRLHDDYRNHDLVSTAFGPHAPYTVSDAPLRKLSVLAEELDIPIHMHVHETANEVQEALATDGRRPLRRLHDLGLLSPRLLCVHATQLIAEEIELLSAQGVSVLHCPESNLKLASGFCEVARLKQHGVNVALGTDGGASNNDLDMLGEMRSAALLAKGVAADASVLSAPEALTMATLNGARALGLDAITGSLEVGKFADITAVDLQDLNSSPVYNPISQIVYASNASQVTHVWCAGKQLLDNRQLLTIDKSRVLSGARTWADKIGNL